jgi:hypothetical protein
MKKTIFGGLAIVALAVPAIAGLNLNSGLKPGERVSAFHPTHFSGPLAGKKACFPCTFQNRPQVQVWVNGDDAKNIASIATELQKQIDANKKSEFKAMVVLVTNDEKGASEAIKSIVAKTGAKDVAMSVLPKNDDAVEAYKINLSGDVKNTVFAYKDWQVQAKMVNLKADSKGIAALDGAIDKLVK